MHACVCECVSEVKVEGDVSPSSHCDYFKSAGSFFPLKKDKIDV